MKPAVKILLLLILSPFLTLYSEAQCTSGANACSQAVPRLVKFSGVLRNTSGVSRPSIVALRFVIYDEDTNGTPLWQEVQNIQLEQEGHYEVMLGTAGSEGIPMELFTSGEPRWLGVQALLPGEAEQPRVLLVSVPYALKAGDSQTLGGLPASAFARAVTSTPSPDLTLANANTIATTRSTGDASPTPSPSSLTGQSAAFPGGATNTVPKFSSAGSLVNSQITDQNGAVSVQNLSNILFADRFSGGVAAAVDACPASGCIIYATSPNVNLNLGSIDPGFKAITIYLGPYTYTVKQITLRKSLKIIGMGATGGTNGITLTCSPTAPCNGTALQSINGNNPVFVLPQANNLPSTNVLLSGFRLYGSVGNTNEDGFFLDSSSTTNAGLWFSTLDDIYLEGFAGISIHILGRNDNFSSGSQWLLFRNVVAWRTPGGGNALRLEGSVFELRFTNCEFEGQRNGDGTNIYIGGLAGGTGGYPTSIVFDGLVSQQAALAVQIDGAVNITFYASHHEELSAGYQITNNSNIATRGLTITDSYFAGNVASNGGAGFDLSVATTAASGIFFVHNQVHGNPDKVVKAVNFSSVVYTDNLYMGSATVPPTAGITTQVAPASSINIQGVHSIGLNASTTPITTIQSSLGPGEMVTFFTFIGPVIFGSGGNINLMGESTLTVNGSITFVRNDLLGGLQWTPVSQWSPSATSPTSP